MNDTCLTVADKQGMGLVQPPINESWGSENTSAQDMLIPRIALAQDLSDSVKKGTAKAGDLVHSTTGEILAHLNESVEIIPISTFREWIINDIDEKGRDKYRNKIPMTAANEDLPLEEIENGQPIRRVKTINFFVLLPKYINDFPFLLSFKKTSLQSGKKLSTHFQMSAMKNHPPAKMTFKLRSEQRSWDGYSFYGMNVDFSRTTNSEELITAKNWYYILNKAQVKIETDEGQETIPF